MLQPCSSIRAIFPRLVPGDLRRPSGFETGATLSAWPLPAWQEDLDALTLRVGMPGYGIDDLRVELRGETLSITGHRSRGDSWRTFQYAIAVPPGAPAETFSAELDGGVLVVRARRMPAFAHAA